METLRVSWKQRGTKVTNEVHIDVTTAEKETLTSSLKKIQEYLDITKFKIEVTGEAAKNTPIWSFTDGKKQIAEELGISQLP